MKIFCKGQEIQNFYYRSVYNKNMAIRILSYIVMLIPALGMLLVSALFFTKEEDSNRFYSLSVAWLCPWLVTTQSPPSIQTIQEGITPPSIQTIYCRVNKKNMARKKRILNRKKSKSDSKLPPKESLAKVRNRNKYIEMQFPKTPAFIPRFRSRESKTLPNLVKKNTASSITATNSINIFSQPQHDWVLNRDLPSSLPTSTSDSLPAPTSLDSIISDHDLSPNNPPSLTPSSLTPKANSPPIVDSITVQRKNPRKSENITPVVSETIKPIQVNRFKKSANKILNRFDSEKTIRSGLIESFREVYFNFYAKKIVSQEIYYSLSLLDEINAWELQGTEINSDQEFNTLIKNVKNIDKGWRILKEKIDKNIVIMKILILASEIQEKKKEEEIDAMQEFSKKELEDLLASFSIRKGNLSLSNPCDNAPSERPHCTIVAGEDSEED